MKEILQDEARYTCNEGYMLVGVQVSRCQASGRWGGNVNIIFTSRLGLNVLLTFQSSL